MKEEVIKALFTTDLEQAQLVWAAKKLSDSNENEEVNNFKNLIFDINHEAETITEAVGLTDDVAKKALFKILMTTMNPDNSKKSKVIEALLKEEDTSVIKMLIISGIDAVVDKFTN